jgi:hypothetical protein
MSLLIESLTHQEILRQIEYAQRRFGDMASAHEAYGVLLEEVAELLDAIRANNAHLARDEALQVAAVAIRLADHCTDCAAFRKRSGFA